MPAGVLTVLGEAVRSARCLPMRACKGLCLLPKGAWRRIHVSADLIAVAGHGLAAPTSGTSTGGNRPWPPAQKSQWQIHRAADSARRHGRGSSEARPSYGAKRHVAGTIRDGASVSPSDVLPWSRSTAA